MRFVTGVGLLLSIVALEIAPTAAFAAKDPPAAEPTGAEIRGRVFRSDGKAAIEGAVVSIYTLDTGKVYSAEPTPGSGEFVLTGLPYGYADLYVETADGMFAGNQVLNLAPGGKVAVSLNLSTFADKPPAWWSGREPKELPGSGKKPIGIAELQAKARGREFWKSPAGIATLSAIGAAVLIAVAVGGGSESDASPSSP
jgi:hypothetical protein